MFLPTAYFIISSARVHISTLYNLWSYVSCWRQAAAQPDGGRHYNGIHVHVPGWILTDAFADTNELPRIASPVQMKQILICPRCIYNVRGLILGNNIFSSAWLCQQNYCDRHPSSVRPSIHPLTQVSQKPLHGSRPNFTESYLFTISPDCFFFQNFQFPIFFYDFSFIFVNMGPYGNKGFKTLLLLQFSSDMSQTLW